jgi:hypothetical protein
MKKLGDSFELSAIREIAGYGRHDRLHEQSFFELAGDQPVEVVFAMTEAKAQRFLDLIANETLSLFYIRSRASLVTQVTKSCRFRLQERQLPGALAFLRKRSGAERQSRSCLADAVTRCRYLFPLQGAETQQDKPRSAHPPSAGSGDGPSSAEARVTNVEETL